ncbi:TPA: HNH endonuclease [Pseudomonas aeruginosa]
MKLLSRSEAKAAGLVRYFTGQACKHGHISERLTVNGSCIECTSDRMKAKYRENREENLRQQKIRRDSDPDLSQKKKARARVRDPGLALRDAERKRIAALKASAIAAGLSTFDLGTPCKAGHMAPRFVHDGKCVECNRISCAERYEKRVGPERRAELDMLRAEQAARKEKRLASAELFQEAGQARRKARASGAVTYFSRKPCPRGHVGARYLSTGMCTQCTAIQSASPQKKAYDKRYQVLNKDRIEKRTRVYREANREKLIARAKKWAANNPEKRKIISKNNKAKRRAIEGNGLTFSELSAWEKAAPKVCHWCSKSCKSRYHIDHYQPLSKGGLHEISNLVIACPTCNLRKSAKDPYEFAASMGRLF